jgi:hypothetical protein
MSRGFYIGLVLSLAACGADSESKLPSEDVQASLAAEGIDVAESHEAGRTGENATAATTCTATFLGCEPPTCGGFDIACENLAEWASQCTALIRFHCGPS